VNLGKSGNFFLNAPGNFAVGILLHTVWEDLVTFEKLPGNFTVDIALCMKRILECQNLVTFQIIHLAIL
jgi:hypothetical protein